MRFGDWLGNVALTENEKVLLTCELLHCRGSWGGHVSLLPSSTDGGLGGALDEVLSPLCEYSGEHKSPDLHMLALNTQSRLQQPPKAARFK